MEEHSPNWTAYYTVTPPPFTHPETLLVLKEETQTRDQLARENRRNERHADSVHVQHLLQAESRGLKTGDHDVLLHAAHSVHAERKGEEDQSQIAVGLRADLLVVAGQLEHYS